MREQIQKNNGPAGQSLAKSEVVAPLTTRSPATEAGEITNNSRAEQGPKSLTLAEVVSLYERYQIHCKKGMSIDELVRKKQGLTHNAK